MEYNQNVVNQKKRIWRKTISWIIFAVLYISFSILINIESNIHVRTIAGFLLLIVIVDLILLIQAEKYYNRPFIFILFFITGLFWRSQQWPEGGSLIAIALICLIVTSLINSKRFLFKFQQNTFLKWFGSISSFIISIYSFAWYTQRFTEEIFIIFSYSGVFLFIIAVLGMIFILPNSNFISWSESDRKIFFRAILVPMGFVFILILLGNVFTDVYFWILKIGHPPWDIASGIELRNLEGITKY